MQSMTETKNAGTFFPPEDIFQSSCLNGDDYSFTDKLENSVKTCIGGIGGTK